MEWDCVETKNTYELTFTISFSSLDEYQSKVSDLTGVPDCVTVTRPQVGVKTGFTLTENTDIVDLFSWLSDALSDRTGISSGRLDNLLQNGSNAFIYAGREYAQTGTGLYAYVETLLDAEQIDILTDLSLDNTWARTVRIRFPSEMLDNASNVKPYLTSLLPEGVTEAWENSTTWTLTFPASDITTLGQLMASLFQSQENSILTETVTADTAMHFTHYYKEPLNLAFFVPDTGETTVRYFIKNTVDAELSIPNGSGYTSDFPTVGDNYDGYLCLYSQKMSSGTLEFAAAYQYQPLEILADTEICSAQDIRQTITLEMGNTPPDCHRRLMFETLQQNAGASGDFEEEAENGLYRIRYIISGTSKNVLDGFTAVFGSSASLSYEREFSLTLAHNLAASYSSSMDFSSFLASPNQTLITVRLRFPSGDRLADDSRELTALSTNGSCQMAGTTHRTNYLRPVIIALAVFTSLLLLYLFLTGPAASYLQARKRQTRRNISARNTAGRKTSGRKASAKRASGRKTSSSRKVQKY